MKAPSFNDDPFSNLSEFRLVYIFSLLSSLFFLYIFYDFCFYILQFSNLMMKIKLINFNFNDVDLNVMIKIKIKIIKMFKKIFVEKN